MLPALTESTRKVLDESQTEARKLNQDFVSAEHVLLAILESHGNQASRILRRHHVDAIALRTNMLAVMPYNETSNVTGKLPMSPKAQKALNDAIVLSRGNHEPKVTTRHLLLALMDDPRAPFVQSLREFGVDVEALLRDLAQKHDDAEP